MSMLWQAAGIYVHVLLNIAFIYLLLGLCLGMLVSIVRLADPSQAIKALVPFTLALFAPIALMLVVAALARQFLL